MPVCIDFMKLFWILHQCSWEQNLVLHFCSAHCLSSKGYLQILYKVGQPSYTVNYQRVAESNSYRPGRERLFLLVIWYFVLSTHFCCVSSLHSEFCTVFILNIWHCKFTLYLQITLFTVLRRKKKCIRYLQGEGRCTSPVSSDGSAIDSPPSPLDTLQCISSAFTSDKLATPADFAHKEQSNPFPISIHVKSAPRSSGLTTRCSPTPHVSLASSNSSEYSMPSTGT